MSARAQTTPLTRAAAKEAEASGSGRRPPKDTVYENAISVSHPTRVVAAAARKAVNSNPESSPALNDVVMAVDTMNVIVNSATKAKTVRDLRVVWLGSASTAIDPPCRPVGTTPEVAPSANHTIHRQANYQCGLPLPGHSDPRAEELERGLREESSAASHGAGAGAAGIVGQSQPYTGYGRPDT